MEDSADFDFFFREYYVSLYSYVHSLINDWEVSRDIASEAFEYLWKNFDRMEKATAKSYLFIYVRNRSIDYLRHRDIQYAYAELAQKLYESYAEIDLGEQDERMVKIQKVMNKMTPHTRHILEECYLHEKKYKEVAEELNISISAVRKHIVKALKTIREELAK